MVLTFRLPVTLRLQDKRGLCFKKLCFLHTGMLLAFNFIPATCKLLPRVLTIGSILVSFHFDSLLLMLTVLFFCPPHNSVFGFFAFPFAPPAFCP